MPARSAQRVRGVWLAAALAVAACAREESPSPASQPEPPTLARGAGIAVVAEDLEPGAGPAAARDPRRRLEQVIARKLAAAEARRRGLDRRPEVARRIAELRRQAEAREEALLRDQLFAAVREELVLDPDELQRHYELTRTSYTEPRVRLRRRPFASEAEARALDEELGPTGRLDPASSEEIGPLAPARLPRTVLPEALALREPGQRAVVAREGGFALVELVEVQPAQVRSFEDVRPEVEESLRALRAQERFRADLERLRREAGVVVDEAALAASAASSQRESTRR